LQDLNTPRYMGWGIALIVDGIDHRPGSGGGGGRKAARGGGGGGDDDSGGRKGARGGE